MTRLGEQRSLGIALMIGAFACGRSEVDADAGRTCDPGAAFVTIAPVAGDVNDPSSVSDDIRLMPDELTAYFSSNRLRTDGQYDVVSVHRASLSEPFTNATAAPGLGEPSAGDPNVTADGLDMLFDGTCAGLQAVPALCWAHRDSPSLDFGAPSPVKVGTSADAPAAFAGGSYVLPQGTTIYFQALALQGHTHALARATRPTRADPFGTMELVEVDPAPGPNEIDGAPVVSVDETTLYFARFDTTSQTDRIWVATRATPTGPFANAHAVSELSPLDAAPNWVSADGCRLYLTKTLSDDDAGNSHGEIDVASR